MADGILLKIKADGAEAAARGVKAVGSAVKSAGDSFKKASKKSGKLSKALRKQRKDTLELRQAFTLLAGAATALGVVGTVLLVKMARDADRVAKAAKAVGTSAEEFQIVIGAFQASGLAAEQTEAAVKKLGLRIGQVAAGAGGPAVQAFEKLGITAAELEKLPLPERMAVLADRIGDLKTQSERAAVANALFEESGLQMVGAFSQGGEAIRQASAAIEAAGVVTNQLALDSEALVESMQFTSATLGSLQRDVLAPLVPALTNVSDALRIVFEDMRKSGEATELGEAIRRAFVEVAVPAMAFFGKEAEDMVAGVRVNLALLMKGVAWTQKQLKTFSSGEEYYAAHRKFLEATKRLDELTVDFIETQDTSSERWQKFIENAVTATAVVREFQRASQGGPGAAPGANGAPSVANGGTGDPVTKQLEEQREYYAELQVLQQEAYLAEQERMRMLDEQRRQYLASSLDATRAGITAVGDLAGSVSTMVTALYGQNSAEAKKAAKAAFLIQKMAAIAEATVNLGVAISEAAASAPPPANIPAIIAASVIGGAAIASIVATTIAGVADAGLPPGVLRQAGLNNHTVLAVRRDEMVLDPKGTQAITEMLQARQYGGSSQPVVVNTRLELDGRVLGETVDDHLVRSSERGLNYQSRIRYGKAS